MRTWDGRCVRYACRILKTNYYVPVLTNFYSKIFSVSFLSHFECNNTIYILYGNDEGIITSPNKQRARHMVTYSN